MSEFDNEDLNKTFREIVEKLEIMATTTDITPSTSTATTVTTSISTSGTLTTPFNTSPIMHSQLQGEEIQAIRSDIRLPSFWVNSPEGWFIQVESIFALKQIRAKTQYNYLVSCLPEDVVTRVLDILTGPDSGRTYENLKTQVLSRLTLSEEERLNRVLFKMEIGDQKPSDFYRRMVHAAGQSGVLSETLIYRLWIKRLPKLIECSLIPLADRPINERLSVADSLFEVSKSFSVNEISPDNPNFSSPSSNHSAQNFSSSSSAQTSQNFESPSPQVFEINSLRGEISELRKIVEQLSMQNNSRQRSRSRGQSFSNNFRPRSRSRNSFCYYHAKFGVNAHKCIQPCSFVVQGPTSNVPKNQ